MAANDPPTTRDCGTMEVHERLLRTVPEYAAARLESENRAWRHEMGQEFAARAGVTVIPIVVHVVHKTNAQNISDAQIQSQIEVLNRDFRKTNPDAASTPPVFAGLVADARIEFVMASTDPSGNATNGITRTSTTVTSFTGDDKVKAASTGGADAWPSDKYLNLWVCQLGGGLLGYAQFPGGPAATDGVVVTHTGFGTSGTAAAPFNLGRTATHEIGHWLNLRHIWGDDGTGCNGSDFVADTPNAAGPNTGTPAFPHVTCNNGPSGDLFMNYMDYTDDVGMFMFTAGQVTRIQACLDGDRPTIGTTKPDPGTTVKFSDDIPSLKITDDPATLKFSDDPQTLKFSDDPQTLKFADDPATLKFRDDLPTLKFSDDPATLKFRDDVPSWKFIDDPITLKFSDDGGGGGPTIKFADDPATLKFRDDGGGGGGGPTIKFSDDGGGGTNPAIDPVKSPNLDKPPGGDVVKPAADVSDPGFGQVVNPGFGQVSQPFAGATPFVLATPHHSRAWMRSFPGAAQAALASLEAQIRQYEEVLGQFAEAEAAGALGPEDAMAGDQLYAEYQRVVAEYRQLTGG